MNTQEAMRLAEALEWNERPPSIAECRLSADLLRQQAAEIERLTARGDERGVELAAALAEIKRLRVNAERYRWLRNKADPDEHGGIYVSQYGVTNSWGKDLHLHLCGSDLDAAIDAARKA